MQLKRKEGQHITVEKLQAKDGRFDLIKHYESYIKIEKMFKSTEQDNKAKVVLNNVYSLSTWTLRTKV